MMSIPDIVVIDNEEEELIDIQNGFFAGGIPCLPIHYQNDFATNKSGIDHVELEGLTPRIIVSDLNLRDLTLSNPKELVPPVFNVLKKLDIKGPYILVFWSAIPQDVQLVMNTLQERFYSQINLPIHFSCIEKNNYRGAVNADSLKAKLKEIISESALFNALVDWEGRVALAARETTNSLFKLTKPDQVTQGQNYQLLHVAQLQSILAVIGNESIGYKNAHVEPEVAMDTGLAPVLHDHLQTLSEAQGRTLWKDAVPNIGIKNNPSQNVKAQLNSFYHVQDAVTAQALVSKRGAWVELEQSYISIPANLKKLEKNLGKSLKSILYDEFLNCKLEPSAERETARNATKLGFIELSAECDQAQRKTKLHRFLLSALIPIEHQRFTMFGDDRARNTAHSGIYRTPNLMIDGQEYIVKVSFMYQIGAIPDVNKWLGAPKFLLKDQILADISYQCSQHASRPGINRFD